MNAATHLPHGAFDFRVSAMADHDDLAPRLALAPHFHVYLGHQWASGIEHPQATCLRFLAHRLRHAVCREDHRRPGRRLAQLLDEPHALGAQIIDDEPVVHDFMAHIDRRTEAHQCAFDDFDGAFDAGAETSRIGKQDVHGGLSDAAREGLNKWLRRRIAALRRARSRAYRCDMSWSLRAPRLALHPSHSLVQSSPKGCRSLRLRSESPCLPAGD